MKDSTLQDWTMADECVSSKLNLIIYSQPKTEMPWQTSGKRMCPHSRKFSEISQCQAVGSITHYTLMKRVNIEGLKEDYTRDENVGSAVDCLMSLPLLPPREIAYALFDIKAQFDADNQHASRLLKLIAYVNRQWITKRSIGPERLSVRDNRNGLTYAARKAKLT